MTAVPRGSRQSGAHATAPHRVAARRAAAASAAGLDAIVAAIGCVLVASRLPIRQGVNLGVLASLATLPLWVGTLWRKRLGPLVLVLSALALLTGTLLTWALGATHRTDVSSLQIDSLELVGLIAGIGLLLWSVEKIGSTATALWFGVGLMLALSWRSLDPVNPWKFSLSVPVIVLALSLAAIAHSRFVDLIVLMALVLVCVFNDSRSAAAMLLAAAAMVIWQGTLRRLGRESTPARTLAWLAVAGALVYVVMRWLLLAGAFGAATQARTAQQLREAGSILLGARPELGATLALFQHNPWGFGAGTLATPEEVHLAKTGMAQLNYNPNNGYVERYMLGNGFELHSMAGDMWARFGLPGALLMGVLLVLVVWGVAQRLARRQATGLQLYLLFQVGWDTFFSPLFFTSIGTLMLAVALTWPPRSGPTGEVRRASTERRGGRGRPARRAAVGYPSHATSGRVSRV